MPEPDQSHRTDRAGKTPPLLSICIPTHHGRAAVLDRLIARLAEDIGGADVEICVSDNASRDETTGVLAHHAAVLGARLVAARYDRNLGLARNLLAVAQLARGRFIWFLGSDDLPVPGAVDEVLALLAKYPHVTGACVALRRVDHRDLNASAPAIFAEGVPGERRPAAYESLPELLSAVGLLPWALSANVIRRDAWQAAVAAEGEAVFTFPNFPQVLLIGRAMRDAPHWAWHPRQLVLSSAGTYYLDDPDQLPGDPIRQIAQLTGELDRVFARLHGRLSPTHRALLYRWQQIIFDEAALQSARLAGRMSFGDDVRQLASGIRNFWWLRSFRHRSLRILVVPSALATRWRSSPLPPATGFAVCAAPAEWWAGYQHVVRCSITNRGKQALPWLGRRPVRLGSRWYDEHGQHVVSEGPRAAIVPALRSGREREIALRIDAPHEPGRYLLRIAPVQERVQWFDDVDPTHGWAGVLEVSEPPALAPVPSPA